MTLHVFFQTAESGVVFCRPDHFCCVSGVLRSKRHTRIRFFSQGNFTLKDAYQRKSYKVDCIM